MPETAEEKRRRILSLAKESISKAYSTGEHSLMQAVNAYNELERVRNLLQERIEEWYGIYFPEFMAGPEQYARFVIEAGSNKKEASGDLLARLFKDNADSVMKKIQSSIGNEPSDVEYAALKNLAGAELELIRVEKEIDSYLMENVPKAMPNISYLIDYKLAAELLSRAGSLTKLANMPASTVQLLGAEKALFRHLRSGSRAPKYGVLFKLKDVTIAERWNKGRVARMFAAKLSIAARADAFSKRFIGDVLKASLEKSIAKMPVEKKERPASLPQVHDEKSQEPQTYRHDERRQEPQTYRRDDKRQEPRTYRRDDRQTRDAHARTREYSSQYPRQNASEDQTSDRPRWQERRYDQTKRPPWQGRPGGPKRYGESESRRPWQERTDAQERYKTSEGRRPWQDKSGGPKRYGESESRRPWQARSYNYSKRPREPERQGSREYKPREQENRAYEPQRQGSRDYRAYRPQRPQERGEREYGRRQREGEAYRPQRYGQREYQDREQGHYRLRPQSEERGPSGFRPHRPRSDRSRAPSGQHRGYKQYKRGKRV